MTNYYLSLFQVNLQVEVNGYDVTKAGEVRDKIKVFVWRNGIKRRHFKALSGGQQSRVNICNVLALHKIINNGAPHGKGINLLIFDEYIDSLDLTGKQEALKILSKTGITSMLIMHQVEGHFPHTITVQLEKQTSQII